MGQGRVAGQQKPSEVFIFTSLSQWAWCFPAAPRAKPESCKSACPSLRTQLPGTLLQHFRHHPGLSDQEGRAGEGEEQEGAGETAPATWERSVEGTPQAGKS